MDWNDLKPQSYYDIDAVLDLAYAMNEIHDLKELVESLRDEISDLNDAIRYDYAPIRDDY